MQSVSKTLMLVGGVNGRRDPKSRIFLDQRLSLIASWFQNLAPESPFQVKVESVDAGVFLFEVARAYVFRPELQILHFSGFIGEEGHLVFTDDPLDEGLDPVELAKWLRRFPNLKFVFLDGCASQSLVEHILRCDIPAVVAIPLSGPRDYPGKEASFFYRSLIEGGTLRQAFTQTAAQFRRSFSLYPVKYDLDADTLNWERTSTWQEIEPGLYFLEDRKEIMDWKPVMQPVEKKVKQSGVGLSFRFATISRSSRILGSGLITLALASLLFFVMGGPGLMRGWAGQWIAWRNDCTFTRTAEHNMIWMGAFDASGKPLTEASRVGWKEMEPEVVREPSAAAVDNTQRALPTPAVINEKLDACHAQWAVYVQAKPWRNDSLTWQFTAARQDRTAEVFSWRSKKAPGAFFFHWLMARIWADQGKNIPAIEQLLKIPVVNTTDYGPVAAMLADLYSRQETPAYALAYANLAVEQGVHTPDLWLLRARLQTLNGFFAEALQDYQAAIDQDSTLQEAWFQRGLLLLSLKEIPDAKSSAEALLRLNPESGQGYGLQAAAAAAAGDSLLVFQSVTRAYALNFDPASLDALQITLQPFSQSSRYPQKQENTGN